jgi:hypothetical protein
MNDHPEYRKSGADKLQMIKMPNTKKVVISFWRVSGMETFPET